MRMLSKISFIALFFFLFSFDSISQNALNNQEIIMMQGAKVSQDIILAKISASKCQFDLTAQGLIDLKAGKISDKVVRAMFVASPPKEVMTNNDVIKLSNSDVSTTILKEKISKTPHQFEVDSESLIKLKAAKVNDGVVKEMIFNPVSKSAENSNIVAPPVSTSNSTKVATTSPSSTANAWENVIVTNAFDEVKGLTRIGEVSASASRAYGKEERLRKEAIEKLKKEAASKGATHVLLQSNNFAPTPLNTVSLGGVAYKK